MSESGSPETPNQQPQKEEKEQSAATEEAALSQIEQLHLSPEVRSTISALLADPTSLFADPRYTFDITADNILDTLKEEAATEQLTVHDLLSALISKHKRSPEHNDEFSGEHAAQIASERYSDLASAVLEKYKDSNYRAAKLHWDTFSHLLGITRSWSVEKGRINASHSCNRYLTIHPDVPLFEPGTTTEFQELTEGIINNSFFQHNVSGKGAYGSRAELPSCEATAQEVASGLLRHSSGFYTRTTIEGAWGEAKVVLYFNQLLMELMTPGPKATSAIIPYNDGTILQWGYEFHSEIQPDIELKSGDQWNIMQRGDPRAITRLLSGTEHTLTGLNDILGVLVSAEAKVGRSSSGRAQLVLGPLRPELIPLLKSGQDTVDYSNNSLAIQWDNRIRKADIKEGETKQVTMLAPIARILPSIISGIIEYDNKDDDRRVVSKIAIPNELGFTIHTKDGGIADIFSRQPTEEELLKALGI